MGRNSTDKYWSGDHPTSYDVAMRYGQLSFGEIDLLKDKLTLLAPNPVVVNIGAGYGTSTLAILEARPDAFVFSIDRNLRREEFVTLGHAGIEDGKVLRIWSESYHAGRYFPFVIDMVFIDGDHSASGVTKDIGVWLGNVASGGLVAFHDYKHRNVPWVTEIVDEAMKEHTCLGHERYLVIYQV